MVWKVNEPIENDSRIIISLDYPSEADAVEFLKKVDPGQCRLKIGKELFTVAGPQFVRCLVDENFSIFLDLKFHDIPNTVSRACQIAADMGVWMVNVHAAGGEKMLRAARQAIDSKSDRPLLVAVTVLTSMDQDELHKTGIHCSIDEQVNRLADLSYNCGLDGVVCSAQEARTIRQKFGASFCLVTPGIRPATVDKNDQHRTMTPAEAIRAGSDYLVIGRPITRARDPYKMLEEIKQEINSVKQ